MRYKRSILASKWGKLSLQWKLTAAFVFISIIILFVNLIMYFSINNMMGRINQVYVSNINLNDLSDSLDDVQNTMTQYLNTKSSDAIDAYYRSEQNYRRLLLNLNTNITDNEMLLMEKNIKGMSENYLETTFSTIQAKRGRNVERYNDYYKISIETYQDIHAFIYSLNNEQFKYNSKSYELLMNSLHYMEIISITILILLVLVNIGLIILLTRTITKPLNNLAKLANEVSKGNLDIEAEVESEDEVGIVSRAFNKMIRNLKIYIEQIRENMEKERTLKEKELMMEGHLKDAKLKYLQAQINPHFLFNTLNAGVQLAMMEGADKTSVFIEHMADFFRYNIKKLDQEVTMKDEIQLVDSYIYIINVRFSGKIQFVKEIEEEYINVKLPAMILQPIVENAVNYGVHGIDWDAFIKLSVYRKGQNICISVKDNGVGMPGDKIDKIMGGEISETDVEEKSNGVGLENVINRLRMYFNCEEVLEIKSEGKDKGTEVIIYIPL